MSIEPYQGRIKEDRRTYSSGYTEVLKFDSNKNILLHTVHKNDSLTAIRKYSYNDGVLIKEEGDYEVEYAYPSKDTTYVIPQPQIKKSSFPSIDTIIILNDYRNTVIHYTDSFSRKTDWTYEIEYNRQDEIEEVIILANNIDYGRIKNEFDDKGRIKVHKFYHNLSMFVSERGGWTNHFRNKVSTVQYNDRGLISEILVERYNPIERKWEGKTEYYTYEFENINNKYRITSTKIKGDTKSVDIREYDHMGNWVLKSFEQGEKSYQIKRQIMYY